jgi:hypothetical protein
MTNKADSQSANHVIKILISCIMHSRVIKKIKNHQKIKLNKNLNKNNKRIWINPNSKFFLKKRLLLNKQHLEIKILFHIKRFILILRVQL